MVKAIETTYAGCRFRSRLEARWAVFFDALRVKWQYEPERIEVGHRLTLEPGAYTYLPDFWLPEYGLWVEVKGSWTEGECFWFLEAAASIADFCGGPNVLICGPFVGDRINWPGVLHMHKGNLLFGPWHMGKSGTSCLAGHVNVEVAGDNGSRPEPGMCDALLRGYTSAFDVPMTRVAIDAARSARFEHGQSGAVL